MLLVIPLAGRGTRYTIEGYTTPKPLINVAGKPMLYHAFQSVKDVKYSKLVFIALSEHEKLFGVRRLIQEQITENFELILLDEVTEGQLCTVLKAAPYFKENEGLLIAASDSYIESNISNEIDNSEADGIISVIDLPGEQWSFAKTNNDGNVIEVTEKIKISNHASTGIYYFKNAKQFELEAERILANKETTKGEYYIMPLYAKLIKKESIIKLSLANSMWDMGTPDAKQKFEQYLNESKI